MICNFCDKASSIKLNPCANGDYKLTAGIIDKGIVIFQFPPPDKVGHKAMGYFDIKYCPICGAKLKSRRKLKRSVDK